MFLGERKSVGQEPRRRAAAAHHVAGLDHHLLREEDLLGGDLHAQVTARNHDGVALLQDFLEVLQALLVLHLADDLDLAPLRPQHLHNTMCTSSIIYKRNVWKLSRNDPVRFTEVTDWVNSNGNEGNKAVASVFSTCFETIASLLQSSHEEQNAHVLSVWCCRATLQSGGEERGIPHIFGGDCTYLSNVVQVRAFAHEGSRNEVDVVGQAPFD